jgi:hypothetical protein
MRTSHQTLVLTTVALAMFMGLQAHAQRGTTTIQGPGFKMEQRNGWFGTQQNVYSDVLGNRVEQKQGWFGRRQNNTQILGNRLQRDNRGTTLTDNNGNVILKRRRGWLGGEDTTINTDGIFQRMKNVFSGSSPSPYDPNNDPNYDPNQP